jgi:hypothetical protein
MKHRWHKFVHFPGLAMLVIALGIVPGTMNAQQGYVRTSIKPGRAGVFIDGKYVGPAANFGFARKYAVAPGEHEIKFDDPRYEEITTKVTVVAGKTVTVRESMKALPPPKPPFGRLRTLSSDKFAAVYVNGKYMGHADEFSNPLQGLLLNPGEYTVKIVPLSGKEHEEKVTISADQTVTVRDQ